MNASKIVKILDSIAPPDLAYDGEELGFVIGDGEKEVKVVGVTERPTVDVLKEAVAQKVDLLVIHEPLFHSEKSVVINKSLLTFSPNKKRRRLVEEGKISVFRYHSQWDEAEGGNNDTLAELLDLEIIEKIPFGRIGSVAKTSLDDFAKFVKQKLGCEYALVVGDGKQIINKVSVVAGSGNSLTEMIEYSKKKGADVLVSGDITDGRARFAKELGLCLIDVGDYRTENPGALMLTKMLQGKIDGVTVIHLDTGDPWTLA